ncbi:hypothetical protein DQ04_11121010 [Trypanosoma grayi]|uniref:hypothetical protein n=1 Tax=Trypanosoma grayi TaxID=71804 RepID=UPI0004F45B1B|nr:hypothetical protein DQ04_11121010 [Trypanosoma grayi]KEG07046.1 hypothetical protein DQ04_11121010 [Trypanosoma grayi]
MGVEWKDRRGRLAYVFAPHPFQKGFVCVNLALLEYGLAYVCVLRDRPPGNINALLAAQTAGRTAKRHMWANVDEEAAVCVSAAGALFHRAGGPCVSAAMEETALRAAVDALYTPCPTCKPLEALRKKAAKE